MRILLGVLTCLIATLPAFAAGLSVTAADVGETYMFTHGKSVITLANPGEQPLRILSIKPRRQLDRVIDFPSVIAPKSTAYATVDVVSVLDSGSHWHAFTIETGDSAHSRYSAPVHVFGLSVLDDALPEVDLGVVDAGAKSVEKDITLSSREVAGFRITRVIETPDFARAAIAPDHRTLVISSGDAVAWGMHSGWVKVAINSDKQSEAWIKVGADFHGPIVPSPNPLDFGMIRKGENRSSIVQLRSRDDKPFKMGTVQAKDVKARTTISPCVVISPGCVQLDVAILDEQPTGLISGAVTVQLPELHRELRIDVGGLLLDEGAKVRSLNEEGKAGDADGTAADVTKDPTKKLDLKEALNHSVEQHEHAATADAVPGNGPLLKWQVANEQLIHGYLIYRSDSENGEYMRVNESIIHATTDGSAGLTAAYQWRDNSAKPGSTYWYYIGILNKNGTKQQLSGPQKVVAR